jgi:hypothetical protein
MQNLVSAEFFCIWQQRNVDGDWRSAVLQSSNAMCGRNREEELTVLSNADRRTDCVTTVVVEEWRVDLWWAFQFSCSAS